jgi:limonene-1,2-epoxide hydrolase
MKEEGQNTISTNTIATNQKIVSGILHDEVVGNWQDALTKLDKNYSMTWVNQSLGELFRTIKRGENFEGLIKNAYAIKGRNYDVKNIASNDTCVMVELVESYPDPETKKIFRTPLVLVLECADGKIVKGRHYYDPTLSSMFLSEEKIDSLY